MLVMTPHTETPIAVCDECGLPVTEPNLGASWIPDEGQRRAARELSPTGRVYFLHDECRDEFAADAEGEVLRADLAGALAV
jgi:hypothetical protein